MTVALNMRAGLARIRMAKAFKDTAHLFAYETAKFATAAYLCGRVNGRAEAGLASAGPNSPDAVVKELMATGGFEQQRVEISEAAGDVLRKLADTLYEAVVESDAGDVLAQWDGFGRFCREALGVEPMTVLRAFGAATDDPAADLPITYGRALDDSPWANQWTRSWDRRFGTASA